MSKDKTHCYSSKCRVTKSQPHLEIYYGCKTCGDSITDHLYDQKSLLTSDSEQELDLWGMYNPDIFGDGV